DDLHPLEVKENRGFGAGSFGRRVCLERWDVDDREVRAEAAELAPAGAAEEVPGEDAGPRRFGVDAERPAMRRSSADEAILGEQVPIRDVVEEAGAETLA